MYSRIKEIFVNYRLVFENYVFMTLLQVLNTLFYLIIYPYLIRTLGTESYGLYVYATSIVFLFTTFVGFGFDLPAVKSIAQNQDDAVVKSHTLSSIFTAKMYIEIVSLILFSLIVFSIPSLKSSYPIFYSCFLGTLVSVFLPVWYFQGVQKMRTVTLIQLIFKILSLPFIFIFIQSSDDIVLFALITNLTHVLGALAASFIIVFNHKLPIRWLSFSHIKPFFKDALPFFWTNAVNTFKYKSIEIILGSFFGMSEVAIYDLANKIYLVPSTLAASINSALFPKVINSLSANLVKKIISYETILGTAVVAFVALLGKPAVLFLGGVEMLEAYPIAILLSVLVYTFLIVGSYINFIFVPTKNYYIITKNQLLATFNFFFFAAVYLYFYPQVISLAAAIVTSALLEIVYCRFQIAKYKLLS